VVRRRCDSGSLRIFSSCSSEYSSSNPLQHPKLFSKRVSRVQQKVNANKVQKMGIVFNCQIVVLTTFGWCDCRACWQVISVVCAENIDSWKEKLEERGYEPLICSVSPLSGVALIIQVFWKTGFQW
jgi:hypothetical protein